MCVFCVEMGVGLGGWGREGGKSMVTMQKGRGHRLVDAHITIVDRLTECLTQGSDAAEESSDTDLPVCLAVRLSLQ